MLILTIVLLLSVLPVILQAYNCSCAQFTTPPSCNNTMPLCSWNSTSTQCEKMTGDNIIITSNQQLKLETTGYCNIQSNCNLAYGCAYYNYACTMFLGCDAYFGYSKELCFNISYLCTWEEGSVFCKRSSNYDTDGLFNTSQLNCTLAPTMYQNVDKCQYFSPQCVYNGFQCAEELLECEQYSFENQAYCNKLIGAQGKCKAPTNSNWRCQLKKCEDIQDNNECIQKSECYYNSGCHSKKLCSGAAKTMSDCQNTLSDSCYFDGKQCTPFLKTCSSYGVDNCDGAYGVEGLCEFINGNCQRMSCSENNQKFPPDIFAYYCQRMDMCIDVGCSNFKAKDCMAQPNCYYDMDLQRCLRPINPCELFGTNDCPAGCQIENKIINKQNCFYAMSKTECIYNQLIQSTSPCVWDDLNKVCQLAATCDELQVTTDQYCKRFSPTCDSIGNQCIDSLQLSCSKKKSGCDMSRGCLKVSGQCQPLHFDCDYGSEQECIMNWNQYPCRWNKKCLRYEERDEYISQEDCEMMSNKWVFENNECKLLKRCSELNYVGTGFEGNCAALQQIGTLNCSQLLNQDMCEQDHPHLEIPLYCFWNSTCSQLTDCMQITKSTLCQKYNDKCVYRNEICYNKICRDLTPNNCGPIKAFSVGNYQYCSLFGDLCLPILPNNREDCFLFSNEANSFEDEVCAPCNQTNLQCSSRKWVAQQNKLVAQQNDPEALATHLQMLILLLLINQ